ncbi:hypothetical protein ACIPC1_37595 [Streptomyces sp. NPDC087263]|uniref:hypothetical protein n=1 Tax=Streptomyces sp. NPDC087263 TaxID=3365773 RepID=UPI00381501AC
MIAGWCTRTVRAAMFAAVCVLLAALGHVLMSGSPVPWWAMSAAAVVTGGLGWCLARRERGLPLVMTVVVVTQGVLHSAFSLAQSAGESMTPVRASGVDAMGHDMGSMHMDAMHMGSMHMDPMDMGNMTADPTAHMGDGMGGPSALSMLAAHLVAALLCGLWLGYGERAAFRILRALTGRLAAPLRLLHALPTPPHRPRVRAGRASSDRAPTRLLLVHAITSRGPPTGTAVV